MCIVVRIVHIELRKFGRIEFAQNQQLCRRILRRQLLQIGQIAHVHADDVVEFFEVLLFDLLRNIVVRQIVLLHDLQGAWIGRATVMPLSDGRTIDGPEVRLALLFERIVEHGLGNW